jgi:hypothetical protein
MKKNIQRVKIGNIKPNPTFRHETLPASLIERIRNFTAILAEVFDTPLQEVIDNFRRDAHPESEVEIWEKIARNYQEAISRRPHLSPEDRKEMFSALLKKSMG